MNCMLPEFCETLPARSDRVSGYHAVVAESQDVLPDVKVTLPMNLITLPEFELVLIEGNLKKPASWEDLAA